MDNVQIKIFVVRYKVYQVCAFYIINLFVGYVLSAVFVSKQWTLSAENGIKYYIS
jgi:hypothetical protein